MIARKGGLWNNERCIERSAFWTENFLYFKENKELCKLGFHCLDEIFKIKMWVNKDPPKNKWEECHH